MIMRNEFLNLGTHYNKHSYVHLRINGMSNVIDSSVHRIPIRCRSTFHKNHTRDEAKFLPIYPYLDHHVEYDLLML